MTDRHDENRRGRCRVPAAVPALSPPEICRGNRLAEETARIEACYALLLIGHPRPRCMADAQTMHLAPVDHGRRDNRLSAPAAELRLQYHRSVSWWEASIPLIEVSHDEELVP